MIETNVASPSAKLWPWLKTAGIIILLALVAWLFSQNRKLSQNPTGKIEVKTQKVDANKLPANLPSNLPVESGGKVVQNFNITPTSGGAQSIRSFVSEKTVDQNYQIYFDYLKNNGWQITNQLQQANYASLSAAKQSENFLVAISKNTVTGLVTVTLSGGKQ